VIILGMIVMDESRLLGSDAQNMQKWDEQIRRDRNHPSVGLWSVGERGVFSAGHAAGRQRGAPRCRATLKQLDPTRPTTYAAPQGDTFEGINGVIGGARLELSYRQKTPNQYGKEMDSYRAKHPDQPQVGTEQGSHRQHAAASMRTTSSAAI